MKMMKEKRELQRHNHTIQLSDMVRVTDPCYDMDVWCAGTLKDVLPGGIRLFLAGIRSRKLGHANRLD